MTTEGYYVPLGTTVYVDSHPMTLVAVASRMGRETLCPPYYGLTGREPRMPLKVTTVNGGDVYWVSHMRVKAWLPVQTKFPTPGRPAPRIRALWPKNNKAEDEE